MRKILTAVLALLSLLAGHRAEAEVPTQPVVMELFTSQGCSSCPPADRLLKEMAAADPALLPLSFHVHYWDYLGWKDPFSSPIYTDRQKTYAQRLSSGQSFTPQLIINGEISAVGSNERSVRAAVADAKQETPIVNVALKPDDSGKNLTVFLSVAGNPAFSGPADVWGVTFDRYSKTNVGAGENGGSTLENINNVTDLKHLGVWRPTDGNLRLPAGTVSTTNFAVLVQAPQQGRILGAAVYQR